MDAAGVIAHYVMDGDSPLSAESAGNTTFYLYGLGAIGEKTTAWNCSLLDGTNTPRQLSTSSGEITLSARYTPWGDTVDISGSGAFAFGYFGVWFINAGEAVLDDFGGETVPMGSMFAPLHLKKHYSVGEKFTCHNKTDKARLVFCRRSMLETQS